MAAHAAESVTFERGDVRSLPHTDESHHLTLTLVDVDAAAQTAVFELHNPEAQPDEMVGGLVWENQVDVENANHLRDKLHLPEKPVPLDTFTMAVERVTCRLHEKLLIGDRVWTLTAITPASATLTPGHDFETNSVANTIADVEYGPTITAIAKDLNALD